MGFKGLTDNEVNALAPHTFRYSIAIMQYYDSGKNYVGSGTLIKIGPRFFIATAGHNLAGVPDRSIFYVYSKDMVYEQLPFVCRRPLENEREPNPDVGYIEIPSEVALSMSTKEFLPFSRINPFVAAWPTRVFLTGFPADMVPTKPAERGRFILSAIGYLTEIKLDRESDDKSTNIYIDYESTSVFVEKDLGLEMPEPFGLSGGGLWALPIFDPRKLWKPDDTTLIGIERSWIKESSCVCCTQIQHWLKLVANDYPDLSEIIDECLGSKGNSQVDQ